MFYYLSKTLDFFLFPLSWFFIFLIFSLIFKRSRIRWIIAALGWLYLTANPWLSNWTMLQWEKQPVAWEMLPKEKALAVILSGVTNPLKSPSDRVYLNKGADRIMHTVELYKKGIVDSIFVSGSYTRLTGEVYSEAAQIQHVLVLSGVPQQKIFLEEKSKNTKENAELTTRWYSKNRIQKPIILITSGFHMRRAVACFKNVGLEVIPFPTDFYTRNAEFHWNMLLPSQNALQVTSILFREVAGYAVYKLMGYA